MVDLTPLLEIYDDFSGDFWGVELIKSEHNHKIIQNSLKHNLNSNFVRNLIIYSKGCKQLERIPNPFKEPVITQ